MRKYTPTEKDRQMLADPGMWPRYPILPLKRRHEEVGHFPHCGFAVDHSKYWHLGLYVVFIPEGEYGEADLLEMLNNPDRRQIFETIEGLLDAGWVVD